MKKVTTLFFALCSTIALIAQPMNDDCNGIVDLGDAPICPSPAIYTNVDATESNIGNDNFPNCFNTTPQRDVWFSFNAVASIQDYLITVSAAGGAPISQPQVAVYRGDCEFDGLVLLECASAALGDDQVALVLNGLTPGLPYFLRINDWSASASPNSGTFELCVEEFIDMEFNIDEGGTDLCEGTLYDTGGPNGNYSTNENNIFSICPPNPGQCIVMNVTSYGIENGFDQLNFYDGPDNSSPLLGTIATGANQALNGGVCYQVVATSGCLSVELVSDFIITFAGFEAEWYCTDDCPEDGTLDIDVGPSANDLEAGLDNPFFDVTVTNINCNSSSYGLFQQGDQTNLGLDEGLLLTTGSAAEVANPASFFANNNLGLGGDPDLNELNDIFGQGGNTSDACFVELDVVAKTDRVSFEYVFGSDEYKEDFSQFSDDLIGILIAGPGITGLPGLNFQENLAELPTVPGTLISIQSVNASNNWEYYRNNLFGQSIAYNGLTAGFMGSQKTLLAERMVTPCETYQVKIAIGDTDAFDDSGLFVKPSISGRPDLTVDFNTGIDYLVENCTSEESILNITIPEALTAPTEFDVQISGTATLGDDYTLDIPSTVTFMTGETLISFPIAVISDGIAEGTETIVIDLVQDFGCGEVAMASLTIELADALNVQILPDQDTVFVCEGINTTQLQATGATGYSWSPAGIFDNPNSANPTATINSNILVTLSGTLGSCTETDEIFLQLISPEVNITANGSMNLCQGESVTLSANNNVNDAGLTWEPEIGLSDPGSATTDASPFATTTYTATVTAIGGCSASDQITVNVEPFSFPEMVIGDTTICQNSSVKLATDVFNSSTDFEWSPDQWLDDATIAGATATPEQTTTYTLTATSPNGTCTDMAQVTVTVLPADVEIVPDTLQICLGDSVQIEAITSTAGAGLSWSPTDSLTVTGPETVTVNPQFSTWYFATLEIGSCVVSDSVYVKVDSLPALQIEAIPAKEFYCQGENISLISPNYAFQNFPDMTFQWEPPLGVVSEDSLFNLVVNSSETATYIRTTTNGACSSMDSIEIIVVPVANITVTPEMPSICPGESVDLVATADQDVEGWMWSPAAGLSCDDCPDPTATPPSTITYQVQAEFMGCPAFAQVTVEVEDLPVFSLNPQTVCPGDAVELNQSTDPNATYLWQDETGVIVSTDPQPVVTPTETTTYSVTIDNGICDPVVEEVTVTVVEDFELTLENEDVVVCRGNSILLSANASTPGVDIVWSPAGANGELVPVDDNTTFVVTATSALGCFVYADSFLAQVVEPFFLDSLLAVPDSLYEGDSLQLQAFTTPTPLDGPTFEWSLENTGIGSSTVPNFTTTAPQVDEKTIFVYEVKITDEYGCMSTAEVEVLVLNSAFGMPNVFTPNGDGTNDTFAPVKSSNVQILDFRIWDRWGNLVYENENGDQGWDGNIDDNEAVSDVYIFYLEYNEGGEVKVLKGDVTLLR